MAEVKRDSDVSSRLSSLETEVHGIQSQISLLAKDIRDLTAGGRTRWGELASWAAVVCMIVGGFSSTLYIINQSTVQRVEEMANTKIDTMNALSLTRFADIQTKVNGLDSEMKIRDKLSVYEARFGELDIADPEVTE